jgi:predicted TPR repeat methyltransferase
MTNNQFMESERYFRKALSKQKGRDFAAAESFYKKTLRLNPMHLDANYLLGTLYAELRQLDKALKFLHRAEAINPHSQMVKNNLGNVYLLARQYDQAIACYQQALSLDPNMPEVYNNLGNIYKNLEQYAEAESAYRHALTLRPSLVETCCNLGDMLRKQRKFSDAVEYYRQALELLPNYKAAHEGLGTCYAEMGDRDLAVACFKRCLELAPDEDSEVRLRLARLHAGALPERYPAAIMLNTYEKKAENWDQDVLKPGKEFLGPGHVQTMLKQLQIPQSAQLEVLDIGCGTGLCGEYLRRYAKQLVGVDLSAPMLAQARKKGHYHKLECAEALSYMQHCSQTFDLLIASGVLILFGDLLPIFQAAAKLLSPGGVFIFTLYRSDSDPVAVRHNLHFAHSEHYIRETAQAANLQVKLLEQHTHEFEQGIPQPGWVIALSKP